jgi:hypothetical protein
MKNKVTALVVFGSLLSTPLINGCTQMPTEKQSISDMRPQISFKTADDRLKSAKVVLDGLDMGSVGDYINDSASLRILSGTHVLRLVAGQKIILDEKFYAGDGTSRSFTVTQGE